MFFCVYWVCFEFEFGFSFFLKSRTHFYYYIPYLIEWMKKKTKSKSDYISYIISIFVFVQGVLFVCNFDEYTISCIAWVEVVGFDHLNKLLYRFKTLIISSFGYMRGYIYIYMPLLQLSGKVRWWDESWGVESENLRISGV